MIILVTGPESSGTRVMAAHIGQHPDIHYPNTESDDHTDPLDAVWHSIEKQLYEQAKTFLEAKLNQHPIVLTRRSLPHGKMGGAAEFMEFANIVALVELAEATEQVLVVLVTVRSPMANIVSMLKTRASVNEGGEGVPVKALTQYSAAYLHLLGSLVSTEQTPPFYLLPLEALMLDEVMFLNGVWRLMGLMPGTWNRPVIDLDRGVNEERYEDGEKIFSLS